MLLVRSIVRLGVCNIVMMTMFTLQMVFSSRLTQTVALQRGLAQEYCLTESFEASCDSSQVIVVDSAKFGRMRLGKCVTKNYGFIGCFSDVLSIVDSRCSGRQQCHFGVSDPAVGLLNTTPCPKDFASYLEASYTCQAVMTCSKRQCQSSSYLKLTQPSGHLASLTTSELGCGSALCPWLIQVQPGQRINITVIDFSLAYRNSSHNIRHRPDLSFPLYCHEYAMIKESQVPRTTTICGGDVRHKQAYLSSSHRVEVHIVSRQSNRNGEHFMLHYEAIGCPNLQVPQHAWAQRSDQKVIVRCNYTRESWTLTCVNTDWVGEMRNCSPGQSWTAEETAAGIGLPSVGVSVLIIFGVALVVVIYIAISIICVLYFRRHRRRRLQAALEHRTMIEAQMRPHPNCDTYEERTPMLIKPKMLRKNDTDYTDICEMQLLNSHSNDAKSPASILKCQGSRAVTLSHDTPPPPAAAAPECCANATALSTFRTFKPKDVSRIYECSQAVKAARCAPRPYSHFMHELDAAMLPNCHSLLSDSKGGAICIPDIQRDLEMRENASALMAEGLDNAANTLKENV